MSALQGASGLPWHGEIAMPIAGVNHAYRPLLVRRADGHMGASIGKTPAIKAWQVAEGHNLVRQGIPTLPPATLVTLMLVVTMPADRTDIDAGAKLCIDLLATYLGRTHPDTPPKRRNGRVYYPRWNDLRVRRLVIEKRIKRDTALVEITVSEYADDATEEGAA